MWMKYRHKFADGPEDEYSWHDLGNVTLVKAETFVKGELLQELEAEYWWADHYRGIEYEFVDRPPDEVLNKLIIEAKRLAEEVALMKLCENVAPEHITVAAAKVGVWLPRCQAARGHGGSHRCGEWTWEICENVNVIPERLAPYLRLTSALYNDEMARSPWCRLAKGHTGPHKCIELQWEDPLFKYKVGDRVSFAFPRKLTIDEGTVVGVYTEKCPLQYAISTSAPPPVSWQFSAANYYKKRNFVDYSPDYVGYAIDVYDRNIIGLVGVQEDKSKGTLKNDRTFGHAYKVGDRVNVNSIGEATIVGVYIDGCAFQYVISTHRIIEASVPSGERARGWFLGYDNERRHILVDYSRNYIGYAFDVSAENIIGFANVQEENAMNKKESSEGASLVETVSADFSDAGYRVAAKQISKGTRTMLIKLLRNQGAKRAQIKAVSELLETEAGLAMISVGLGWALKYMPGLADNPRAQFLAKEFRVDGLATGGNLLFGSAMDTFLPMILSQLQSLPEPPKLRVLENKRVATVPQNEHDGEDQPVHKNTAKA